MSSEIPSIINCKDMSKSDIILLAVNYDRTSSFGKGSDKAPRAIKNSLDRHIELFDRYVNGTNTNFARIFYLDFGNLNGLRPEQMVKKVSEAYKGISRDNKFPIIIGGEHSVTNSSLEAIASQENASQITVVQLDAHADLRNDDSDYNDKPWGRYAHCSVMRRAHELGYNLVQVGVRAFSEEELDYALKNRKRIKFFEWSRFDKNGKAIKNPTIETILTSIGTQKVYLTIDVDGFDPAVMPETGTPVPGGFSWEFGVGLIMGLFRHRRVIGADLVEVAPESKHSRTAYNAAQMIYNIIGQHIKYK